MITGFTGSSRRITSAQKATVVALIVSVDELHHGDCIVADEWAHRCAIDLGKRVVIHPPDEEKSRAFCARTHPGENVTELPTKPFLERNDDIVTASERLIAVPNKTEADGRAGGGVWATVRYARKKGIPITIVHPDGRVEEETPAPPEPKRKRAAKKLAAAPDEHDPRIDRSDPVQAAAEDAHNAARRRDRTPEPTPASPDDDEGGGKSW